MKKLTVAGVVAALGLGFGTGPAVADAELTKLMEDPNYWAMPAGDYANQRYSELNQINSKNASNLKAAWTFSTGVLRGHEGGPLVLPGSATGLDHDTLFIHAPFPNNVFAINLNNLEIVWEYAPQQDYDTVVPVMCCDTVNRGLGYGDGKIFLQQADTTLVALEADSGEKVWSVKNGDPEKGETNTNAPHVFGDKVITGISGGEFGVRGFLVAYNIDDGSQAWKAYSTGPDDEMLVDPQKTTHLGKPIGKNSSLNSWCAGKDDNSWSWNEGGECAETSDQWKTGGGTTWGWFSYDPELNLVYYGTGNPSTWNPVVRPGDNKWSMTIMARDLDTGMADWFYQMTPHDEWDYDGINENILVDIKVKGKERKALVHFDRNGFGYTLDRETGELLVARKYDPAVNWATHVDMKTGRPHVVDRYSTRQQGEDTNATNICPAALGSKDMQPASYSRKTGLFYVPTNHVCMNYEPVSYAAGGSEYTAGQPFVNAILSMFPAGAVKEDGTNNLGNFIAWDAGKGEIIWSIPEQFSVWSGALSTAGNVVFYGTLDGYLKAVNAKSGKLLWKFKTPSGIIGNSTTWKHDGKQYVGILSGLGGWAGIGFAAGLEKDTDGLGAVGAYKGLDSYTRLGGTLNVFSLP
ncbi:MAG: methanol/ethanol family PQQ-dependent dehydrogenase [Gammaproteobacteria bacterium]|nr:methanol/ethanol family PQQ-dependent dehydrogenase [Gammaproteobacteria bacterium]